MLATFDRPKRKNRMNTLPLPTYDDVVQAAGRIAGIADILTATDDELVQCMRFFAERMKIVVEPTGCLGFAAARRMKDELRGKKIGILVSGGNIDLVKLSGFLAS